MTDLIKPSVYDVGHKFHDDPNGLLLETAQEIPQSFVSMLKGMKADSGSVRENEFMHVASIPVAIHHKWLKEGYDCTTAPIKDTVRRLKQEQLDAFIVTNKSI